MMPVLAELVEAVEPPELQEKILAAALAKLLKYRCRLPLLETYSLPPSFWVAWLKAWPLRTSLKSGVVTE